MPALAWRPLLPAWPNDKLCPERDDGCCSTIPGTHLAQQSQDLEAPTVDLERRRAREAAQAVAERVDEVEEVLRHVCHLVRLRSQ